VLEIGPVLSPAFVNPNFFADPLGIMVFHRADLIG